jgi:hypothetical protein
MAELKLTKPKVNIGIGIPLSWTFCHSDFMDSFTQLDKMNGHVIRASSGPIQEMRNNIARRALELDCTHLIFLDADMTFPENTIRKLIEDDKDIIGALTFKRWPPFHPILYMGTKGDLTVLDPYPEDVVEVTATGTGCLMIKINVIEEMPYPWFEFSKTDDERTIGEDVYFCYKAAKFGYKIFVDTTIKTEHLCQMRVNENIWKLNKSLIESGQGLFDF